MEILLTSNIVMNANVSIKEEAIRMAGEKLVQKGYVEPSYVDSMLEREKMVSTFMGNLVAIPHGTDESKKAVVNSGISILQIPNGVDFGNGNIAKVVFGIAGKGNEHLDILSKIAIFCSEEANVEKIVVASSADEIVQMFNEVN